MELASSLVPITAVKLSDVKVSDLVVSPLKTGFTTFDDKAIFKKDRGELIVVGARPSVGKSALMFQIAMNVSKTQPVLVYSLEMDREQILTRMLAAEGNKSISMIQKGIFSPEKLSKDLDKLKGLNYYIDDRSNMHINELCASAYQFSQVIKPALIVVDYLQLVTTDRRANAHLEIMDITGKLKALAKQLKCPVMTASQLNRNVEQRVKAAQYHGKDPDFRPTLGDLRESGSIEADADVVILLSRESMYTKKRAGQADVGIAKNRNGETGWYVFNFIESQTKFVDD